MKGHLENWVCNKSLLTPIILTGSPVIFLQVETGGYSIGFGKQRVMNFLVGEPKVRKTPDR